MNLSKILNLRPTPLFLFLVLLSAGVFVTHPVESQTSTMTILGLQSIEGDDAFARSVTEALIHEAEKIEEWNVRPQRVSLGQMKLLHGCDELDAPCMNGIAFELDVRRLVYGVIRRTGVGNDYQFALTLNYFNAESGELVRTVQDRLPKEKISMKQMRATALKYLQQLIGEPGKGALKIITGIEDAVILLDGEQVESQTQGGTIYLDKVLAGRKQVEIQVEGQPIFRGYLNVVEGQETLFELPSIQKQSTVNDTSVPQTRSLQAKESDTTITWPTYTSFGISAAFLGLGVWSWVRIYQINSDPRLEEYRIRFPDQVSNICPNARSEAKNLEQGSFSQQRASHVEKLCAESDLHEILQWVFVGGAIASAGLGTWFLIDDLSGDDAESDDHVSLTVIPSLGPSGGGVTTRLQF